MGLDILLITDNYEYITAVLYNENKFNKYDLSRTFCNFMCRENVTMVEPELDQIGNITSVDISPIYKMVKHWDDESIEFQLSSAETDEEKEQINASIRAENEALDNNIEIIINTVRLLIEKLSNIRDLNEILNDGGRDTIGYEYYFTDFDVNKGEHYVNNNFGQDMRNFYHFLEFAKNNGATSAWFTFG